MTAQFVVPRIELSPRGDGLVVRTPDAAIELDASHHVLLIDSPTYGIVELGASAPGVAAAAGLILDELDAVSFEAVARELGAKIVSCLQRAAARAEFGCPIDRFAAHRLRWTPLVYGDAFLASRYLIDDLEQFLPCRVALAHVEDDVEDSTIEGAAACCERMMQWRAMFSPTGELTRPLNSTLAEHGQYATPHALWGLRGVTLTRYAQSAMHVELLGSLGRHPRRELLEAHVRIVEAARVDEIVASIARVPRRRLGLPACVSGEVALAELIALTDELPSPASTKKLEHLVDSAIACANRMCLSDTPTMKPPLPLPLDPSIMFLRTVGAIRDEGAVMQHCVATRAMRAVDGTAYFFHVDVDGTGVTVEVSVYGHVVEARGERNFECEAAHRAARRLATWAAAMRSPSPSSVSAATDEAGAVAAFARGASLTKSIVDRTRAFIDDVVYWGPRGG